LKTEIFQKNNFNEINSLNDYLSIIDYINIESWLSPSVQLIDLIIIIFFISFFIFFYFSYYNSYNKENNTVDSDYLLCSIFFESEKEIASLDDLILSIIIITYIFG